VLHGSYDPRRSSSPVHQGTRTRQGNANERGTFSQRWAQAQSRNSAIFFEIQSPGPGS
jgi:hypothetical protein